jgi:hypothetical protein
MKTETQLRAEFYGAISSIVPVYWLSKPIKGSAYPLATYMILDSTGLYSFGISRSAEERTFQLDVYAEPGGMATLDAKMELIKTALETIDYRMVGSQAEFIETDINKIVRVTRWEKYNV